ncbi:MAG: hypothetical protein R3E39_31760 [Anaerolineae bacterium]
MDPIRRISYANGTTFERLYPNLMSPTLILPLGIGLSLTQYSLVGARLVAALYLLAAVAGICTGETGIWGITAIISIFLFLMAGHTTFDTPWTGRQGNGEIPALVFLVWGLWAWIKSWHKGS